MISSRDGVEAEFERFAAQLVAVKWRGTVAPERPPESPRGPLPPVSAERIYEAALELVDREGVDALTARRLAAELRISTRTLYKRIKSRPNLIRHVGDLFASRLAIDLPLRTSWEATALDWCVGLHRQLTSHPHLAELLPDGVGPQLLDAADGVVQVIADAGIARGTAIDMCRTLANTTLNNALAVARLHRAAVAGEMVHVEPGPDAERDLLDTVGLVIDDVRARATTGSGAFPNRDTGAEIEGV